MGYTYRILIPLFRLLIIIVLPLGKGYLPHKYCKRPSGRRSGLHHDARQRS